MQKVENTKPKPLYKPKLRGWLHQEAFFVALGACTLLIAKANGTDSLIAVSIYSASLLLLFAISAIYHRPHWEPKPRAFLKRLDHSAIFIVIAGTFSPLCLLSLPAEVGKRLLWIIWILATIGILQSIFWVKAPKFVTAIFYVIMGWQALPFLSYFQQNIGSLNLSFLVIGGVFYTVGAVFYALKWPKLNPKVFGYHEVFHLFTIFGVISHFIVVYRILN